jgi:hypothetical protein
MKRIVHIAKSHKEAREWDIEQCVSMTPAERQAIAKQLKIRVYGKKVPDVRQESLKYDKE